MILDTFETLYDRTPPTWLRKTETAALMAVFARAFQVDPPNVAGLSAADALAAFREFTAACMGAALVDEDAAKLFRRRLGAQALALGDGVRRLLKVRPSAAFRVARFLYSGIGIRVEGALPGAIRFCPCSFAARYTPADCWFMSAFDEGFMRGISGMHDVELVFSCRLTQGASCCLARFE